MRKLILVALTLGLCGCVKPVAYKRPAPPVPPAWPESAAAGAAAGAPAPTDVKWKEFFTDDRLRSVIDLALNNNRDLRTAALGIERMQALYRIQSVQHLPVAAASVSADAYRQPANMSSKNASETVGRITAGLGAASWELDLFGRIRSLKSAALERYLASEQARSATQIGLVGAVAGTYLSLAADRDNLRLAQETLRTQQASYELIRQTREAGLASDLELRQSQSQVEAARVDIARFSGQVELDINALNLLAGTTVPSNLLPGELGPLDAMKDIGAGLPSEVLLRRPDILNAEHQLMAANANIGVARAAFFPRIALTAAAGFLSGDLANLFTYGNRTWEFAPEVGLPIFDYGARKANLKVTQVDRDVAVAQYEKAIQSAFREVSDSLSLRTRLVEQQDAQQALVKTLEETYRLSDARYRGGIDSYLNVLVAQRALYGAQQVLIGVRLARMGNLVSLYKVLGGGA